MGALADKASIVYLRPETAQGIFVNFHNVRESSRMKVPFGIAQIGKAFRNEIVKGNFIFRMVEFEQMEMQYFVKPGTQAEAFEAWREERFNWYTSALGINRDKLHWCLRHQVRVSIRDRGDRGNSFKNRFRSQTASGILR